MLLATSRQMRLPRASPAGMPMMRPTVARVVACHAMVARTWRRLKPRVLRRARSRRRRRTAVTSAWPTARSASPARSAARVAGNQLIWRRRSTSGGTVGRVGLARLGLAAMRCSIAVAVGAGREAYEEIAAGFVGVVDPVESRAGECRAVRERLFGDECGEHDLSDDPVLVCRCRVRWLGRYRRRACRGCAR